MYTDDEHIINSSPYIHSEDKLMQHTLFLP